MEHTVRLRRFKPFTPLLLLVLVGLIFICLRVPVARAATFTVTKTADTNDGTCNADCSLREAIRAANLAPGSDMISLPAGTYTLTIANATTDDEDDNATGDLDITGSLSIIAAGASTPIIDAAGLDRVIELRNIGTDTISVGINGVTTRNGMVADSGGGVYVATGTILTLVESTVQGNRSTGGDGGGGLYIQGSAQLILQRSSVISNTDTSGNGGGGIKNNNLLSITSSTVSANTTTGLGGGISSNSDAGISNSTIANNRGSSGGGGILVTPGNLVNFRNTILSGNTDGSNQPRDCSGTLTSQGYNLIQSIANCIIAGDTATNITGVNPNLGPLAANGGPTLTHALLAGSVAIDAGNPASVGSTQACETVDQRNVQRPLDGDGNGTARCDIGAFEREQPVATATTTATVTTTGTAGTPSTSPTTTATVTITGTASSPTPTRTTGSPTATRTVGTPSALRIYLPLVVR